MSADESLVSSTLARDAIPVTLPRADVYRGLVRNNLLAVIRNAFPVTIDVLGMEAFDGRVADFLADHGPVTSLYRDIPEDVVRWALEGELEEADLMHYEWLELVAARHPADVDAVERSRDGKVRLNPTLQIGVYQRPVHLLSAERPSVSPSEAPMVYLVWRRPETDEVAFHRMGQLLARLLAAAQVEPATPEVLVDQLLAEQPGMDAVEILDALRGTVTTLRERDGVL
jgi:hypothetical protein